MRDPPPARVVIADFPGLAGNVDPRDLPQGAAEEQVNATSEIAGELRLRQGIRKVTFAED